MQSRAPLGFTIVEALVATVMLGIAGTTLVASLTVARVLRARGAMHAAVARAATDHAALLAHRPCAAPDTSGTLGTVDGIEGRWTATHGAEAWQLVDSAFAKGTKQAVALAGSVSCQ